MLRVFWSGGSVTLSANSVMVWTSELPTLLDCNPISFKELPTRSNTVIVFIRATGVTYSKKITLQLQNKIFLHRKILHSNDFVNII